MLGELSLGDSFGALKSGHTPDYLQDSDDFFLLANLNISFGWLKTILQTIPFGKPKRFSTAQERLAAVFSNVFLVDIIV